MEAPRSLTAPEQTWEIRNPEGEVVATHHRVDKDDGSKVFWWSSPGYPKSLGGLKTAELPLYGGHRLGPPDPSEEFPVYVTEGEKACDALLGLGVPAVGTVGGAKITPSAEVLKVLRDRHVVLWPDNDDEGREHMRRMAAGLKGAVRSLRVFEPAGLPPKGDAVEWLAANGGNGAEAATPRPRRRRSDRRTLMRRPAADWLP